MLGCTKANIDYMIKIISTLLYLIFTIVKMDGIYICTVYNMQKLYNQYLFQMHN